MKEKFIPLFFEGESGETSQIRKSYFRSESYLGEKVQIV